MSKLARNVVIRRVGLRYEFTIDGEPFPWLVSTDGFSVHVPDGEDLARITFTLLADHLELEQGTTVHEAQELQ